MTPIVSARNLGKCYQIQPTQGPRSAYGYRTLRDDLSRLLSAPLRMFRSEATAPTQDFWALRDICFDIHKGDVVGVIGHNGAGKSTLLKVLSRITKPTVGGACRIVPEATCPSSSKTNAGFAFPFGVTEMIRRPSDSHSRFFDPVRRRTKTVQPTAKSSAVNTGSSARPTGSG